MEESIRKQIKEFLKEDVGDGDHTSIACILETAQGKAKLLVKQQGVLAGVAVAREVFSIVDPELKLEVEMDDGSFVRPGDVAFYVSGSSRSILTAERLVLNLMQRMSAIATKTREVVNSIKDTGARILDTRKTTPGLRYFEKLAVKIGGGENHRFGLYDMIMIKDNHIDYAGGIPEAIDRVKTYLRDNKMELRIEVEARNIQEVREILSSGAVDRIMLDNFNFDDIREAVSLIGNRAETEASGGITEETVREYAECGVTYISMGALTLGVKSLDLSLKAAD